MGGLQVQVCNLCHLQYKIQDIKTESQVEKTEYVLWFQKMKSVITTLVSSGIQIGTTIKKCNFLVV
jgi:hypothetical protein